MLYRIQISEWEDGYEAWTGSQCVVHLMRMQVTHVCHIDLAKKSGDWLCWDTYFNKVVCHFNLSFFFFSCVVSSDFLRYLQHSNVKQVSLSLWTLFLCLLGLHQGCGALVSDLWESVWLKNFWFWSLVLAYQTSMWHSSSLHELESITMYTNSLSCL